MSLRKFLGNFRKKSDESTNQKLKLLSKRVLAERDLSWHYEYLSCLGNSEIAARIPQIKTAQNGFKYLQLEIPDIGKPYEAYNVKKLIHTNLINDGIGIQVYSYHDEPDVELSYGEIVNFYLRGEFRTKALNWLPPSSNQFDGTKELLGGNPNEKIIPPLVRKVMLAYFVKNNVHFPKISLLNIMTDNGIMNQLAFNIEPSQFNDQRHFDTFLASLKWYLPFHYTYTSIPEHYLGGIFHDL